MKKLLKHLQSIDPRITVKVYMKNDLYVIEAGIEGSFCGQVINESFRKAKKQFLKSDAVVDLMREAEALHVWEREIKKRREAVIKAQEELLAQEFETLFQNTIGDLELDQLLNYVDTHNEIRSSLDQFIKK